MSEPLKVGDTVVIRGDKQWNSQINKCCYSPDQLVDGKYLKHTGTGKVWTSKITKITDDGTMAQLGSGYWGINLLEKYPNEEYLNSAGGANG